ncbi:MAG: glycerol-3-phosphate 1-O-acyltransferase PlsY [Nannocystaceae bacterium]
MLADSLLAWCLFAYLVAAIPIGLLIGRVRGVDLRAIGSGNIGATNAVRALGKKWGALVFLLDVLKAYLPVRLAMEGFGDGASEVAWVGLAATLGHIYPVYLGFRGGKGVACALGVFSAVMPISGLMALALYIQTLVLTRTSAIGSLTAVTATSFHILLASPSDAYRWLVLALAAVIWWRHRGNLRSIIDEAKARKAQR